MDGAAQDGKPCFGVALQIAPNLAGRDPDEACGFGQGEVNPAEEQSAELLNTAAGVEIIRSGREDTVLAGWCGSTVIRRPIFSVCTF